MGDFDVPAVIDYVLKITKRPNLPLVAHSQGTTQIFASLSRNESKYANKVSIFVALGPVLKMEYQSSPLLAFIAQNYSLVAGTFSTLGIYEVPANFLANTAFKVFCGIVPKACSLVNTLLFTSDTSVDDTDRYAVYMGHFPSGASIKCLLHFAQLTNSRKFQRYDFGAKNLAVYGQSEAPLFDLKNIKKVPIAMFIGTQDQLADPQDGEWAQSQLQTSVFYKEYRLGHASFMVGQDMSYFRDVQNILDKYAPIPHNLQ